MARWLVDAAATLHGSLPLYGVLHTRYVMGLGSLLVMSLFGAVLVLSMCSLCYTRKKVQDKASSSDGDVSPAKQGSKKGAACSDINKAIGEEKEDQAGKSPHVWQRAILMGERCQRPTFSGLVLYDEKGNPLPRRLPAMEQAKMLR